MPKTFFTSDTHFFHENVIKFCDRPFASTEAMNENLIRNWNLVVGNEDHIWFLGDFSFGKVPETEQVLYQLNGLKHLIVGNHDRKGSCKKLDWGKYFLDVHDYYRLKVNGHKFVLCHFPFSSWERGYINLHGHWHSTPGDYHSKWMQHDVGVDMNNYTPLLLEDAVKRATEGKEVEKLY